MKILEKLQKSPVFIEWREDNKESFLSHVFTMLENGKELEWQIGYYNPGNDQIASFTILNDNIKSNPHEEIVKDENSRMLELDLNKVKFDLPEALERIKSFRIKNYSAEVPDKTIVILQNLEVGTVWNITFITKSFNTLNFKFLADRGEILEHKKNPIFHFKA